MFSPAGERQMFPKQTKRTEKGVLGMMIGCCRVFPMLARVVLMICLGWFGVSAAFSEEALTPHVMVIVNDAGAERLPINEVLKDWKVLRGDLRISPSRAATLAAILYGKPALQSGVVSDHDWRSRAVAGESVVSFYGFQEKGLISHWGDAQQLGVVTVGDEPVAAVIQQGGVDEAELLEKLLKSDRPVVLMYIVMGKFADLSKRGNSADQYHYSATWEVFQHGVDLGIEGLDVDFQVNEVFQKVLAGDREISVAQPKYHFFHRANWASDESVEKYRHRDSLVVGNGFALVDGLDLYAATPSLEPDLSKPLDIAEYPQVHTSMLMEHAKWWEVAREALTDKRPIIVGEGVTRLTAQDWRPSNIIHQDNSSPLSRPIVFQKDLLVMLEGLKNDRYKEKFPAYCGSWSVNIMKSGRYKITARLLPKSLDSELAKLKAGRAFVQLGGNQVQLTIQKGATAVSATTDAEAGVIDLECWFTGQLPLERELGAFFVEIERVGDKKYNIPIGQ